MMKSSQLLLAVASADRGWPVEQRDSPNISPAPIRLRIALRPSGEEI